MTLSTVTVHPTGKTLAFLCPAPNSNSSTDRLGRQGASLWPCAYRPWDSSLWTVGWTLHTSLSPLWLVTGSSKMVSDPVPQTHHLSPSLAMSAFPCLSLCLPLSGILCSDCLSLLHFSLPVSLSPSLPPWPWPILSQSLAVQVSRCLPVSLSSSVYFSFCVYRFLYLCTPLAVSLAAFHHLFLSPVFLSLLSLIPSLPLYHSVSLDVSLPMPMSPSCLSLPLTSFSTSIHISHSLSFAPVSTFISPQPPGSSRSGSLTALICHWLFCLSP